MFLLIVDKIRGGWWGKKIGLKVKLFIDYKDFIKEVYIEVIDVSGLYLFFYYMYKIK